MKYLIIIAGLMLYLSANGQTDRASIREGNKFYDIGSKDTNNYNQAKTNYMKALDKNPNSVEGNFNLGDVFYQQKKYDSAASKFNAAAGMTTDKSLISKAYHNMGNALLQDKKYDESIEAFKNSLKNNPKDEDTKYNLAYAQSMLQKQQQQQQNKDDKNKKDDKKQDKKDQQKKDDKKDEKKDQQKQQEQQAKEDKDKKDGKEAQPKDQKKMSKEEAERMLQALNNQEKDLQKKLGKKVPASGVIIDKDW
jgi:tetratricopeptide (TPR) repeat protein